MVHKVLASDYDGTIAEKGIVASDTIAALRRFRDAGGTLALVTGREVQDLQSIFPELQVFHWIVAENGAVLHETATKQESLLAEPPPQAFINALTAQGVSPLYVGQVIVATYDSHLPKINDLISQMDLKLEISLNKGAVMILPTGCDKATGLRALLERTGIAVGESVGVGDAENDIPLLEAAGLGVALANALPSLKKKADLVMSKPAGAGVAELIDRLLS